MHPLRPLLIAALALPGVSATPSGLEVRVKEGLVTIEAHEAPLSEVLDQLGRQTGMKLVYEAGRPRQNVSALIEGLPPPVALTKLLEGLGIGYSFSLDLKGTRIETLIMSGVTATASASYGRPASSAARPADSSAPPPEVDEPPPAEEMPEVASPPEPEPGVAAPAYPAVNVPGLNSGGPSPTPLSPLTGPAARPPSAFPPSAFPGSNSAPMPSLPPPVVPGGASNPQLLQ